ncbi:MULTISPECIES: hypothetical protein [Roseobacteraceae]|uniref:Uncharacterized protein n=2 Tax=Roseobacteraceae TaxID=2854170 RepID=A0A1I6V240_9RHOB|nr:MULTISPECIES: hypothetical protein [Roseobacteraceae]MBE9640895.1 hypothetical protein [Salipiger mangrovisoli]SDI88746.1 hypothetical protein SAMN04488245_12940 [Alloyangia pacifica]SFT07743.1 hypothetical protein SAMN04488050_109238 [Alloyangia pacifica]
MSDHVEYLGVAAVSICEALLLALKESDILPDGEIMGVLKDAAATHENAAKASQQPAVIEMHREVASVINRMIAGRATIIFQG